MEIKQSVLKNGLRVISAPRPQIESVSLGIWVNTGSAEETLEDNGISHFIEHMVFKGTKKRNSLQISEDIENAGGSTNAYTSRHFTCFYAKMLKNDLELNWVREFVKQPCIYCEDTEDIGLDRIDNTKGHTKDNVVPCCYACNTARGNNFSFEEMKILGKTIKEIKKCRLEKVNLKKNME